MQEQHLLRRASHNRKALTPLEAKLWSRLNRSQLGGYKFRRQHVIDNVIVDFFCPQKALIVEVDGDTHDTVRDAARDARHGRLGFTTSRFTNADVGKNLDGVLERLLGVLGQLPDRWPQHGLPHPVLPPAVHPSPEGEGM